MGRGRRGRGVKVVTTEQKTKRLQRVRRFPCLFHPILSSDKGIQQAMIYQWKGSLKIEAIIKDTCTRKFDSLDRDLK